MILISHDHADHIAGLDPLLSLLHYRSKTLRTDNGKDRATNKISSGRVAPLIIAGNKSVVERYQFFNDHNKYSDEKRIIEIVELNNWDKIKKLLPPGVNQLKPVIEAFSVEHEDIAKSKAFGIRISIGGLKGPSIAITSDTNERGIPAKLLSSDVLVAHMSYVPMPQLLTLSGLKGNKKDHTWLEELFHEIEGGRTADDRELTAQIEFAYWLRSEDDESRPVFLFPRVDHPVRIGTNHLYLQGVMNIAEKYMKIRKGQQSLMIISELREELATFRTKVAQGLNEKIFRKSEGENTASAEGAPAALTADLGLSVVVEKDDQNKAAVRVLCSTCDVDNDYCPDTRYHGPEEIREVCIKGEDEGIFYNCPYHDPGTQEDPSFMERMERYDIFARQIP